MIEYTYYMVWCRTFEGDRRWHMGRFDFGTEMSDAFEIVRSGLCGGVGGDPAEVLEIEDGWEDDSCNDYTTEPI